MLLWLYLLYIFIFVSSSKPVHASKYTGYDLLRIPVKDLAPTSKLNDQESETVFVRCVYVARYRYRRKSIKFPNCLPLGSGESDSDITHPQKKKKKKGK